MEDNDERNYKFTRNLQKCTERVSKGMRGLLLIILKKKDEELDHSTGFPNYTSVLANIVILLVGLSNAPRNLFSNY
jgi:hypothetical protein